MRWMIGLLAVAASVASAQTVPTIAESGRTTGRLPTAGQSVAMKRDIEAAIGTKQDAATFPLAPYAASNSPAMRTAMARAAEVRSLLDWLLPADNGDAAAALTRLCQAVPGNLRIAVTGDWAWNGSVTACSGRNLDLRGNGPGATNISAAASGVMLDVQASIGQRVTLRDMTVASAAPGGTRAVLRVTYPHVGSSSRGSVLVEDVEIAPPAAGGGAVCSAVVLDGAWKARVNRVVMTAAAVPATGCGILSLSETFETTISHSVQYYGDALAYQAGYAEGVTLQDNTVVAANHLFKQAPSGIVTRSGYTLNGLWLTDNEVATQQGGVRIAEALEVTAKGMHWSQWAGAAAGVPWTAYDLTDVQNLVGMGDLFIGSGVNPGQATGIRLRQLPGGTAAGNNTWIGANGEGVLGIAVDFGPNTALNAVLGMRVEPGVGAVIDLGASNIVTTRNLSGGMSVKGNASIFGDGGQTLLGIANVPGAANAITVHPAAAGLPPYLSADGQDANIPIGLNGKGTAGVVLNTGGGTALAVRPDGAGAQVNYGIVQSGSGSNGVIYTGSPGSNVVVMPGQGSGILALSGIPTCAAALTGQLCSAGSGQPVTVK